MHDPFCAAVAMMWDTWAWVEIVDGPTEKDWMEWADDGTPEGVFALHDPNRGN